MDAPFDPAFDPHDDAAEANNLSDAGRHAEAVVMYDMAIAGLLEDAGRIPASAEEPGRSIIFGHPFEYSRLGLAYAYRAESLSELEKTDEAIESADLAAGFAPHIADVHSIRARIYGKSGMHEKGAEMLATAISLEPDDPESYSHRSVFLIETGDYKEALSCLEKSIELDPTNSQPYMAKALLMIKMGNNDEALASVDMAASIDPDDQEIAEYRKLVHFQCKYGATGPPKAGGE